MNEEKIPIFIHLNWMDIYRLLTMGTIYRSNPQRKYSVQIALAGNDDKERRAELTKALQVVELVPD